MKSRRDFLKSAGIAGLSLCIGEYAAATDKPSARPNILWIIVEDMSCHFGYQGCNLVNTPNVDRLAREGAVFKNAYVTSPVCSPCRSAMITGMYQTTIGAHNHRSSRGTAKIHLPSNMKLMPQLFKNAGYYTCNCGINFKRYGKTDYNFVFDNNEIYDAPDWSSRRPGQPFFAQVQLHGGKYREGNNWKKTVREKIKNPVTPEQVTLPPYYPDHPVIRDDWADYLNTVQYTDLEVGKIMQRLEDEGLKDNTVVFFVTDHGISHARAKQFLYEAGIHIPFIVWAPGRIKPDTVREDLIAHIDMAATSLYFAGIDIPDYMQSRPLFGPHARCRDFVVSARDRCDETVDRIRSVRKGRFKYIRNFYPDRPYLQPNAYKDHKKIIETLRRLHAEGKLDDTQSLIMASSRPAEELYDLEADPREIHNLAGRHSYQKQLKQMSRILQQWIIKTDDRGRFPESEQMYDSDMNVYVEGQKRSGNKDRAREIMQNIRLMKKWAAEGK